MAFLSEVLGQTASTRLPSLRTLGQRIEAARDRRRTRDRIYQELAAHSDRELADLGFSRGDIWSVANGTYRR